MECDNKHKIGVSKCVERRLKQLRIGNCNIRLIYKSKLIKNVYMFEKKLHQKFKEKQIEGEWFILDGKDIEYVKKYCGD